MQRMVHSALRSAALVIASTTVAAHAGESIPGWEPPAYHSLFSDEERGRAHVQARSHDLYFRPFLNGQWEGIVRDSDGNIWFSVSTHRDREHAQVFRYSPQSDHVTHIADVGQACGEKLTGNPPQHKIHGQMFECADSIVTATREGHSVPGNPYKGGYWLKQVPSPPPPRCHRPQATEHPQPADRPESPEELQP